MPTEQDVLRFDVCVDDAAALVQEVQPCQHLANEAALSHQPWQGPHCLSCPSSLPPERAGTAGVQVRDSLGTDGNSWL